MQTHQECRGTSSVLEVVCSDATRAQTGLLTLPQTSAIISKDNAFVPLSMPLLTKLAGIRLGTPGAMTVTDVHEQGQALVVDV